MDLLTSYKSLINVSKLYWVCVSNNNCSPHIVDVFVSEKSDCNNSENSYKQLMFKLRWEQMIAASLLYTVFAVTLCSGRDPHMETYEQNKIRNHLHQVLQLDNFPPSQSRQRRETRNRISIAPADSHGLGCVTDFQVLQVNRLFAITYSVTMHLVE